MNNAIKFEQWQKGIERCSFEGGLRKPIDLFRDRPDSATLTIYVDQKFSFVIGQGTAAGLCDRLKAWLETGSLRLPSDGEAK